MKLKQSSLISLSACTLFVSFGKRTISLPCLREVESVDWKTIEHCV